MSIEIVVRVRPRKGSPDAPVCIPYKHRFPSTTANTSIVNNYNNEATNANVITISKSPVRRQYKNDDQIVVYGEQFEFDKVFYPPTSQSEVYGHLLYPKLLDMKHGINSCIFFTGEKNSGKSYSLHGRMYNDKAVTRGLLHRSVDQILEIAEELTDSSQRTRYLVGLRAVTVDNDKITDIFESISHPSLSHEMTQHYTTSKNIDKNIAIGYANYDSKRIFQKTIDQGRSYSAIENTTHFIIRNLDEFNQIMKKFCFYFMY